MVVSRSRGIACLLGRRAGARECARAPGRPCFLFFAHRRIGAATRPPGPVSCVCAWVEWKWLGVPGGTEPCGSVTIKRRLQAVFISTPIQRKEAMRMHFSLPRSTAGGPSLDGAETRNENVGTAHHVGSRPAHPGCRHGPLAGRLGKADARGTAALADAARARGRPADC